MVYKVRFNRNMTEKSYMKIVMDFVEGNEFIGKYSVFYNVKERKNTEEHGWKIRYFVT